jgi:hypothetical protein
MHGEGFMIKLLTERIQEILQCEKVAVYIEACPKGKDAANI